MRVVPKSARLNSFEAVFEIVHRGNTERVCYAIEESEHSGYVYRFGDLWIAPAVFAQEGNVGRSAAVCRLRDLRGVVEQCAFFRSEPRGIEIAGEDGLHLRFLSSLNTQEVGVRVQSIRTAIEVRHPTGDGFFGAAIEMSLGEMDGVAEVHDLA